MSYNYHVKSMNERFTPEGSWIKSGRGGEGYFLTRICAALKGRFSAVLVINRVSILTCLVLNGYGFCTLVLKILMNREDQRKWVLNARWILLKSWPSKKDLISQSLQTENSSRKDIIFSRKWYFQSRPNSKRYNTRFCCEHSKNLQSPCDNNETTGESSAKLNEKGR